LLQRSTIWPRLGDRSRGSLPADPDLGFLASPPKQPVRRLNLSERQPRPVRGGLSHVPTEAPPGAPPSVRRTSRPITSAVTLREEFLDVPIAQGEAQIEPNRMLADHRRKAVAAVGYFSHRISLPLRRASGLSGYPDKAAPCHSGSGDARRRLPSPTELWRQLTCAHFRPVPLEGSGDRVQYTPFRRWVGPKVPCRY